MNTPHNLTRIIARVLLSGSVAAVAGLGLPAGTAQAGWPGCPDVSPAPVPLGPCHWCPGDPPVQTGNLRVDPVRWDPTVCHTYWMGVTPGNVARNIWEGETPPPPPPPPPGVNFCPIPPWCPGNPYR